MIEVRVNEKKFTRFESVALTRTIENYSGAFRIKSSSTIKRTYPVKEGDFVQILVDGETKCSGFVDAISSSLDETSHTVSFEGRDSIQDMIDSSVPDSVKSFVGPISLQAMCQDVIDALDIDVQVESIVEGLAPFQTEELQSASSGQKSMDFLYSFARKRQVYLVSPGDKRLLVYRPPGTESKSEIIHKTTGTGNNVLSYTSGSSRENRYNKYSCKSQSNYAVSYSDPAEGANVESQGLDNAVRPQRFLEFQAEESMSEEECGARAQEEANLRRAKGFNYSCVVFGHSQKDGSVWDYGYLLKVNDEFANVKGKFLIAKVQYLYDLSGGSKTEIHVVSPDAYQGVGELGEGDKRKAKQSPLFVKDEEEPEPTPREIIADPSLYSPTMSEILELAKASGG